MIRQVKLIGEDIPDTLKNGWFGKRYTLEELFERTEIALGIFPDHVFPMTFLRDAEAVRLKYSSMYGRYPTYLAFMDKSQLSAWFSVEDLTPKIFVHECAHLLFEWSLKEDVRVSYNLHEEVAQYAERVYGD